jgi:hypothetical protein
MLINSENVGALSFGATGVEFIAPKGGAPTVLAMFIRSEIVN